MIIEFTDAPDLYMNHAGGNNQTENETTQTRCNKNGLTNMGSYNWILENHQIQQQQK